MIEFLTAPTTRYRTDVIARHYIPTFTLPDDDREWLLRKKKLVDTTLAHLTIIPMPKLISEVKLPYTEMYRRVMEGLRLFFDTRPPHLLDQAESTVRRAHKLKDTLT